MTIETASYTERMIQQVISSWNTQNKSVTDFFNKYDEDVYVNEIAPGRNRPVYLLGHLIAANDSMVPMFGLGEKLFADYEQIFLRSPDRSVMDHPSVSQLKKDWQKLNTTLAAHFNKMTVQDWMERHSSVSPEDFELNPLRNKLNVLINRTNHVSYHLGQLNLVRVENAGL